jgi:hypothetical protein
MMDCFALVCAERATPRASHIVRGELCKLVHPTDHPEVWELINELENGAWEGGCSEGYEHGFHDGGGGAVQEMR